MRERWLNVRMLSRPNQRWLLRSSGFFIAPCYPKRSFRERRRSGKVAAMSAQLRHRAAAKAPARPTEPSSGDRIESVRLSLAYLPLAAPISDAKVLTGRQKPLTEIAFTFAEIRTRDGLEGLGFGYSKRAGGPGMYAHPKQSPPHLIAQDPSRSARRGAGRRRLGDSSPRRVGATAEWDPPTALGGGARPEVFGLVWIAEPRDAYDSEGHAQLAAALDTPIATGKMLTSHAEHAHL